MVKGRKYPLTLDDVRAVIQGKWLNDQVWTCIHEITRTQKYNLKHGILLKMIDYTVCWLTEEAQRHVSSPSLEQELICFGSFSHTQGWKYCALSAVTYLKLKSDNLSLLHNQIPVMFTVNVFSPTCTQLMLVSVY